MKMKKRTIILVTVAIFLTVWMMFSTSWIADWQNTVKPIPQKPIEREFMGLSFFMVDTFEQIDSIYETIWLKGQIYNISEATDEACQRSMIFSSPGISYQLKFLNRRGNIYRYYASIDITRKDFTGFAFEFCPLGIKDGLYKIILQVEENDEPVTRVATGYVIEKINGHAKLLYRPSERVERIAEVSDWANAGFNEFKLLNDGTLNLTGWGIVNGVNSTEDTAVYLEVFNGTEMVGTFSTTKENILYIAEYFNDMNYYAAGFRASIPGVSAENLKVRVYVKYGDDFYRCSYHFVPDESMRNLVSVSDID